MIDAPRSGKAYSKHKKSMVNRERIYPLHRREDRSKKMGFSRNGSLVRLFNIMAPLEFYCFFERER